MPSKWDDAQKWIASPTSNRNGQTRKPGGGIPGHGNRPKLLVEVEEEFDTKRIDQTLVNNKKDAGFNNQNQHVSSTSVQSDTAFVAPPSTIQAVSMRDMGTEMTPLASQEPSRTGTPARATTPTLSSPTSSPGRSVPTSLTPAKSIVCLGAEDDCRRELTEKEVKLKTRREIMILGTKLGKTNIAAWASKEEEDNDSSSATPHVHVDLPEKRAIEIRAAAWEEAEKSKHIARFKREEIKIQAWENHQKAMAEAELKKIEVKVERTRIHAHDRLQSKLATVRHMAVEKLAVAESKRNLQSTRAAQQADFMRRTGQTPSSSSYTCWSCCG